MEEDKVIEITNIDEIIALAMIKHLYQQNLISEEIYNRILKIYEMRK